MILLPPLPPQEPIVLGPDVDVAPLSWRYTAASGEAWELTTWDSPVIKLRGAIVSAPPFEHWWQEAQQIDGSTWGGGRSTRGSLFMPLRITGASSTDWLAQHARFMRTLDPRTESRVRLTRPDGTYREAVCRYESGAELTVDLDPSKSREAVYGLTWAMADPFWHGEPVVQEFGHQESELSFLPGPPFYLAASSVVGRAKVTNPGDEQAYPLWRVTAPFVGFSVGVGDSVVTVALTKATGYVEVDMRPHRLTIMDELGVNRWPATTEADFTPIPAGRNVDLTVQVSGAGPETSARLEFTPRYRGPLT